MKTKKLFRFTIVLLQIVISINFSYSQNPIPSIMFGEDTILYVYPENNVNEIEWGGYGTYLNTYHSNGAINTSEIVSLLGDNNGNPYAAKVCDTLTAYGYDDWYLPSAWELWVMCENVGSIGISPEYCELWSSSSIDEEYAWNQYFGQCSQTGYEKYLLFACRCVRRESINTSSKPASIISELKTVPDKARGILNVRIKGKTGDYELSVHNMQGTTLETRKIRVDPQGYSGTIDITSYAKGMYIVVIRNGKFIKTGRFVK